ncbi:unnamed protein product [Rhizophagus irregularis]|nr:unnamed protein product [Rhizophagus irregularis]CAB5383123.1 unnamed protein product [Rhizophagus irregularis]
MQHPPPQLKLWRATVPQRAFYTIFGQTHFDVFKSAIITPLSPNHQFRKVCETILYDFFSMTSEKYMFDWIEVQADCIKDVMLLFPEFDLTLNKVDGITKRLYSLKFQERLPR